MRSDHADCDLDGLGVLVTRPQPQAASLAEAIEAVHGRPLTFPAMEILGPEDPEAVQARLGAAREADLLVFVSPNAVSHAFPLLPDDLPVGLRIAAVGRATAQALDGVGLEPDLVPTAREDSEGLLALVGMQQVEGLSVLILRGEDGRPLLGDVLRERGARVSYIEVYRRRLPRRNADNLVRNWDSLVQAVTVTSNEILDNLMQLLGPQGVEHMRGTITIVASRRVAEYARELGIDEVFVAPGASDQAMVRTLCRLLRGELS
jgi:uroporphyrinogen-III synthase